MQIQTAKGFNLILDKMSIMIKRQNDAETGDMCTVDDNVN
jgi:hypothetical protein